MTRVADVGEKEGVEVKVKVSQAVHARAERGRREKNDAPVELHLAQLKTHLERCFPFTGKQIAVKCAKIPCQHTDPKRPHANTSKFVV